MKNGVNVTKINGEPRTNGKVSGGAVLPLHSSYYEESKNGK